jgi:sugar lactone lactonase YvrE
MKHIQLIKSFSATVLMAAAMTGAHAQGTISTVATGFSQPYGVATDVSGNMYIADRGDNSIRMVSATTGATTLISGGTPFDPTDFMPTMGGLAIDGILTEPDAIFVDHSGNIFFTDWWNDAAVLIDAATSHITNICGHEDQGCSGDGGLGRLATMEIPGGIWVDNSGNVYIADYGNNRIRKIDATTAIVNTIAGGIWGPVNNGALAASAAFGQINGVCVDNYGNVYISDAGNHCIRRLDNSGHIRTIAGTAGVAGNSGDGGPALNATINNPGCLFINAAGNLFIVDDANNNVRVVNVYTGIIHTLAGTGTMGYTGDGGSPVAATLNTPEGVWQDAAGAIYIADQGNAVIRKIVGSGYRTTGVNTLTENNVNIFPNPSTGTFTVQMNTTPDNATIEVFNVVGQQVYSSALDQQQTTISLNQPAGVYNVVIKTNGGRITEKVTIAK